MDKYREKGPARFRPSRFEIGGFGGVNRYGEQDIHPSSYQDERGMKHWSDDIRSEASHEDLHHKGKGPKGYRRPDERIREEVCERLTFSHAIDASGFEVNVSEGLVTLEGVVESRYQKRMAEELIEELPGVKDVHNHLSVRRQVNGWVKGLH